MRKLCIDNDWSPCEGVEGNEIYRNGLYEFNISKILEYIKSNPEKYTLEDIKTDELNSFFSTINEEHIETVDINQPLIFAELLPDYYSLIDGNHRKEKAKRQGIQKLQCYRVAVIDFLPFFTNENAYISFVAYWNSKVDQLERMKNWNRKN